MTLCFVAVTLSSFFGGRELASAYFVTLIKFLKISSAVSWLSELFQGRSAVTNCCPFECDCMT